MKNMGPPFVSLDAVFIPSSSDTVGVTADVSAVDVVSYTVHT